MSAEQRPAPRLIKSRRCCIGCGMRPGWIYGNGLCDRCQFPHRTAETPKD
jgi:hypothetical protein